MSPALLADPGAWLGGLLFAMLRVGGALTVAPVFAHLGLPVRIRVALSAAVAFSVQQSRPLPPLDLGHAAGMLAAAQEVTIGLAIGLVLALAFAGAMVAGEGIATGAGLGFSSFVDPGSGVTSPAIGQFLNFAMTLVFLGVDGHLRLLEVVAGSYVALPPGAAWPGPAAWRDLADFGGLVFQTGLLVALPVTGALLAVNLALGVLTRAAPQLNLFAVGVPVTVLAGAAMLALAMPALVETMTASAERALEAAAGLGR